MTAAVFQLLVLLGFTAHQHSVSHMAPQNIAQSPNQTQYKKLYATCAICWYFCELFGIKLKCLALSVTFLQRAIVVLSRRHRGRHVRHAGRAVVLKLHWEEPGHLRT